MVPARGDPGSSDFAVNAYTTYDQTLPRIAADRAGGFVVVWLDGYAADLGINATVRARRFAFLSVFSDGFEDRTTSAWGEGTAER